MAKLKEEPLLQLVSPRRLGERRRVIETCAFIATTLDKAMLLARSVQVASEETPDVQLPMKRGIEVARELAGRYLVRYILPKDYGRNAEGLTVKTYTTITAYRPTDAMPYLNLPPAHQERTHVLLLDPSKIDVVLGPRFVLFGKGGIEYILPHGYGSDAISGGWEIQIP